MKNRSRDTEAMNNIWNAQSASGYEESAVNAFQSAYQLCALQLYAYSFRPG